MSVRRIVLYAGLAFSVSSLAFSLGSWTAQQSMAAQLAANDARLEALQANVARSISILGTRERAAEASGTGGQQVGDAVPAAGPAASAGTVGPEGPTGPNGASGAVDGALIEEIKRQLQSEMGLVPVRLLRERRTSFVELNAVDNFGKTSYGTAGYLGRGYFITVKHGVIALDTSDGRDGRRIQSVTIRYEGRDVEAQVIDSGDASVEVHRGDWAIIRVREPIDLPPLRVNASYPFEFADPIFRLGNDYSKGIILGTGYVGQRMSNGLVTCLTDGHPGVSGGGVLNQEGELVGIPIGRMQGDYRFSFILPVREEMFRKVPSLYARVTQTR